MGVCRICQGGELSGGLGKWHAAKRLVTRGVAMRLLGGMLHRKNFLNDAIWCVLEHIFIHFLPFFILKKSKNIHFLYTNNDKL